MPRFAYKARSRLGRKVDGLMLAENEEELALALREMDLYLVDARPERTLSLVAFQRPVPRRELINFTVQLAASVQAGIPILQAFEDLEQQTTNRRMKRAIEAMTQDLRGGSRLHEALGRHPAIFSEVYVNMVKAGEAGGSLAQVLQRLNAFLEWQESLASEIKRATIYPATVLVAVLVLIGVLLGFVFPRILPVIQNLKVPLPLVTRVVIAVAGFVRYGWYWVLLGGAGFFLLGRVLKASELGSLIVDGVKLRLPVIGSLVEKICLSRFAHHLGALLAAGIDITQTLAMTEQVVGNKVISSAIAEAKEKVIQGGSLWRSLQETGVFPPMVIRMISIGESTGAIDRMMERVTEFYDREIPASVKRLFAVMEPLIIVFLAAVVLVIALSIFVPLYTAMGTIGRR